MRLLLVEDDQILGEGLKSILDGEGYAVDLVQDGNEAEYAIGIEPYEMVILDIGLPGQSGIDVLQHVRKSGNDVPIIMLTARDTFKERISGLDKGADDYIVKPFDTEELMARIRTIKRRVHGRSAPVLSHGSIEMDLAGRTVTQNGEIVDLSAKEFAVLQELLDNAGRVLSKSQLERAIYPWDAEPGSNAVEVYVHHLRQKLGKNLIRTIRNVGYIIDKQVV